MPKYVKLNQEYRTLTDERYRLILNIMKKHNLIESMLEQDTMLITYPSKEYFVDSQRYYVDDNLLKSKINDLLREQLNHEIIILIPKLKKVLKDLEKLQRKVIDVNLEEIVPYEGGPFIKHSKYETIIKENYF